MKFNKYLICALFLVLICCIGAASAADSDDVVAADDTIDEEVTEAVDVSDEVVDDSLGVSEEPALSDGENNGSDLNEVVIYVGQNRTDDGGNGSYENPFSTLNLACLNVSGEDDVNIKIFNGTYYLDTELKFNTSNLLIQGIGDVIIKAKNPNTRALRAIELTSNSANFTIENIIFDSSDYTLGIQLKNLKRATSFFPFYGDANLGIFKNCIFKGFNKNMLYGVSQFNGQYISCIFNDFGSQVFYDNFDGNGSTSFENCIFDVDSNQLSQIYLPYDLSMRDIWFGKNSLSFSIPPQSSVINPDGKYNNTYVIPVNRYAIFSVSENYLGNNQYEIIGKLTWNGTEDQDGMENFQPMAVNLQSTTGDINQTATLVNGNFRAIYTSFNSTHKVTATLHNEEIELEFTTVNITTGPVSIYYGEDQNITFNFTQPITANVTVTVSNGSYNKSERIEMIGKDSITYTVPDTLKEGTYDVEINLAENNLFGFNTTTLTVSKVSDYTFNIDIHDNGNVKADDDLVITIELPQDVFGNVTVKVNDNPEITKEATQNTIITINSLVGGNNNITIAYTGDDKYAARTSEPQVVTAQKASAPEGDNALNITAPADSATPTYSINMPKDATGNLTVIVDGKDKYTKVLVNGSATITLPELSAGKHDINVTYTGDAKYESISKTTSVNVPAKSTPAKTPVAKKAATKITAKKKTFKAKKKVKKYTITLKSGKKPVKKVWVTLKIKGKKLLKAKTNAKGKATFKIKKLTKKGKYNAVIKFKGNKNYKASSKKVKITIKK